MRLPRLYIFVVNQKTDLHEYLAYKNKKILTLMPLKSQVRLRLARVRFLTGHFAWIFDYFLQTIFLANAVICFYFMDKLLKLSQQESKEGVCKSVLHFLIAYATSKSCNIAPHPHPPYRKNTISCYNINRDKWFMA